MNGSIFHSDFNYSTNETQAVIPTSDLGLSQILMLPVFIFIITISILGNALVIASWIRFPSIRNPSNALLVSLASVDFLTGLITTSLAFLYGLNKSWILGQTFCVLWLLTTFIFWFVSSNHLVLIAIDRYRILVEGVPYLQRRSISKALQPAWFIWFLGICLVSPIYFDRQGTVTYEYETESSKWVCETKKTPTWVLLSTLACIFGPLVSLILIYVKVYKELKTRFRKGCFVSSQSKQSHTTGEGSNNTNETEMDLCRNSDASEIKVSGITEEVNQNKLTLAVERERKAAITLGFLILAYVICWALIIVVVILYVLHIHVPRPMLLFAVMLSTMNSGVNPVIYAVRNQEFQRCFKLLTLYIFQKLKFW